MPRRTILSDAELASLLALPDTEAELIRRYTFSDADLAIIAQHRGPANRLGFAVQLCYMRYPGVVLSAGDAPLGSYPRQNRLAVALRELGRIERTLFILEWLQSVELRRRVNAGLNKGEARNALARAVFFNRPGEIRDRSFEQQRHRASGLNLVTAAIVLWNTVYLERVVRAVRRHN